MDLCLMYLLSARIYVLDIYIYHIDIYIIDIIDNILQGSIYFYINLCNPGECARCTPLKILENDAIIASEDKIFVIFYHIVLSTGLTVSLCVLYRQGGYIRQVFGGFIDFSQK